MLEEEYSCKLEGVGNGFGFMGTVAGGQLPRVRTR